MKTAIVYYSMSGNTKYAADKIAESFITVEGLLTLFVRISKIVSKIISKMETTE